MQRLLKLLFSLLQRLFQPLLGFIAARLPAGLATRASGLHLRLQPGQVLGQLQAVRQQALATYREGGLRAFFGPGIRLLNARRYIWKFGLLGALALATTGLYVVGLNVSMRSEINAARSEARALALYPPLAEALQANRQYSLQAWAAAGDPSLAAGVAAKGAALESALAALDNALKQEGDSFALAPRWAALRSEAQKLRSGEATLTAESVKTAQPKFSRLLLDFIGDLGEASGLLADDRREAALIADLLIRKLPQASEQLAALSNTSALLLGSKEMGADWNRMAAITTDAERARDALLDTLARTANANPANRSELETAASELRTHWAEILEVTDREIRKGAFALSSEEFLGSARSAALAQFEHTAPLAGVLQKQLQARSSRLEERFWIASLIGSLLVLSLLYCGAALFVSILQSVRELSEGARHIGEGDLGFRVAYSAHDELRGVAAQFNHMASAFAAIIQQVQRTSQELGSAAEGLASSAAQVAQSSEQQSEAAASMAAAVEEMTVGIDEISRNAGAADEVAAQSGQLSASGGEVVARTVSEMELIAAAVRGSSEVISELGRNSAQISSIVKSIKEIADQTNLLALNASIEAARAGDDGRGFAVVADEVRKLAERTTRATAEIGGMVAAIQAGTTRAVAAMQDGVRRVQGGVDLSNQAGAAMQQIRDESARVLASVSEISGALREQATASTEIAQSVEAVAQMAEANHAQVSRTNHTARELVGLSARLGEDIRRFRT
ncbi:methyl-accepting chemotaxis protein [Uliginosibacterium sp. 31-12]|uniref:methyl-accepting chemotaxis protein n=1 Tax=Uliginosibacterium sp. 31-12 TaxID=3062781 RepID=UPI0026E3B862|nr:methyl-accepting chemotaxis protein [Uliginosibacterium sp. 31-12]MDO6386120.1 methyl-accepting chemotaxis protein [Uliginosibacterium sp. 31-12]